MIHKYVKSGVAAALLCGALVSGSVSASQEEQFGALQGIEAQTLSVQEMDAIHGAVLTPTEATYLAKIDAAMTAVIGKVAVKNPALAEKLTASWTAALARVTAILTKY